MARGRRSCARLVVDARLTLATGTAEREAGLEMIAARPGIHRITLGADKAYDVAEFVADLREHKVTPHVAQNTTNRRSAIDRRTTRHSGYAVKAIAQLHPDWSSAEAPRLQAEARRRPVSALNCRRYDDRDRHERTGLFLYRAVRNAAARIRLAGTATSLHLPVLIPLHWQKRRPPTKVRKPRDDERDPPQRLRHELHRPYSTWNVDASTRSLDRVQHDRLLPLPVTISQVCRSGCYVAWLWGSRELDNAVPDGGELTVRGGAPGE
jgi:hypothetical protein